MPEIEYTPLQEEVQVTSKTSTWKRCFLGLVAMEIMMAAFGLVIYKQAAPNKSSRRLFFPESTARFSLLVPHLLNLIRANAKTPVPPRQITFRKNLTEEYASAFKGSDEIDPEIAGPWRQEHPSIFAFYL
jgi:hypothetical protein